MISEQFATRMANDLMLKHELYDWHFAFDRAKTSLGKCNHTRKTIYLSRPFLAHVSEYELRDTILHEIAHALVGHGAGHGPKWQAMCRKVGADPRRTKATDTSPAGAWRAVCPNGHETTMHRAPGRVRSCGKCSPVFNKNYLYTWFKNGREMQVGNMPTKFRREYERITND